MINIDHKIGDTFRYVFDLPEGGEIDNTWSGSSEVRDITGALISTATFTWRDVYKFELIILDTSHWEQSTGNSYYLEDIQFTSPGGETYSSETFTIKVNKDVTQN